MVTRIYRHTRIARGVYIRESYAPEEYLVLSCLELLLKGGFHLIAGLLHAAFSLLKLILTAGARSLTTDISHSPSPTSQPFTPAAWRPRRQVGRGCRGERAGSCEAFGYEGGFRCRVLQTTARYQTLRT